MLVGQYYMNSPWIAIACSKKKYLQILKNIRVEKSSKAMPPIFGHKLLQLLE